VGPDALGPRFLVLQATGQVERVQPTAAEFAYVPRQVVVPVNMKRVRNELFRVLNLNGSFCFER